MEQPSFPERVLIASFKVVNKIIAWHKLPSFVGVINLLALRIELRSKNLHDVYPSEESQGTSSTVPLEHSRYLTARNTDGKFNSLEQPLMGCAGMRFGRNVERKYTEAPTDEELLTPNPRLVSEKLLARQPGGFKPATIVNLLAAAWIQFQVHDWANHEQVTQLPFMVAKPLWSLRLTSLQGTEDFDIPLPAGDKWPSGHMKIPRSQPDIPLSKTDQKCPAYKNQNTAWWDASQLYGSTEALTTELRANAVNGKLNLTEKGMESFLPRDDQGLPQTGFRNNWWIGLELLHTLFALEHNAICDELHRLYSEWSRLALLFQRCNIY